MRKTRLVVPGYPSHVILRGNNRRRLFSFAEDYWAFARYLGQALVKHNCLLHAWVFMMNHIHLLMTSATVDGTTKAIHMASMRYAQRRNRVHEDTGKLFEQRFLSFPVLNDAQVARVTAYIELNPVRAGICDDALGYRYSSFGLHAGVAAPESFGAFMWSPSPWFLGLGETIEERAAMHRQWVDDFRRLQLEPDRVELTRVLEAVSKRAPDRRLRRPNETRAT
jgi:REP-associated tyrosine transposase